MKIFSKYKLLEKVFIHMTVDLFQGDKKCYFVMDLSYPAQRIYGRYMNATLSEDTKNPKLLPRREWFTVLLIRECISDWYMLEFPTLYPN